MEKLKRAIIEIKDEVKVLRNPTEIKNGQSEDKILNQKEQQKLRKRFNLLSARKTRINAHMQKLQERLDVFKLKDKIKSLKRTNQEQQDQIKKLTTQLKAFESIPSPNLISSPDFGSMYQGLHFGYARSPGALQSFVDLPPIEFIPKQEKVEKIKKP